MSSCSLSYRSQSGGKLVVQVLFHGQPLPARAITFANRYHSNIVTKSSSEELLAQSPAQRELRERRYRRSQ